MSVVNRVLSMLLILFIASKSYCQKVDHYKLKEESNAITTIVFIDNAERGEYMAGIDVKKGRFSKGDFIKSIDKKGNSHYFLIHEIKVNDQPVMQVAQGQQAFLVLKIPQKAIYFDEGQELSLATKKDFENQNFVENNGKANSFHDKYEDPTSYFLINGQVASTYAKDNDADVPSAMLNQQNKKLTIMLYGDQKDQPRRGMVTIDVLNFTPQKGTIKNASFSFIRYKDKAGNMIAEWANSKGNYGNLEITDIKSLGKDAYGESFLISGSFEANLPLKIGYESETKIKSIDITNGTFINVYVQALFYNK